MVKLSALSPENALAVARAGADYMHNNFEFIEPGTNNKSTFAEYMAAASTKGSFETGIINGNGAKGGKPLVVPYKGSELTGPTLKKQLQKWAQYGTMEPDAAMTISSVATGNLDLSGKTFVLIGAGSAMGPFTKLLEHGATVVCIDIPGVWGERPAAMWKRIFETARKSSGRIIFPLSVPQSQCSNDDELIRKIGCNLTEQPAQILNWLLSILPGEPLTVGNYTYLDGDMHVKLSLAADGILKGLTEKRPKTSIAFLCTPTDIHVTTDPAHAAAKANYGFHPGRLLEGLVQVLSFGKLLQKNALPPITCEGNNGTLKLVDGISVAQGPNYAIAKRLQHWRAMIAYDSNITVSSHIAPSTATISVVSNRTFGWAYGGMPYFKPYEIFHQDTTNALMAAILAANITQADSKANPANRTKYAIKNTLELFKYNSVHGGMWRAAYKADSIGEMSVFIHFLGGPKLFLPVVAIIFIGIVAGILKVLGKF
eukprot:CAMPEP_0174820272 /NCGR_PEP_ID=MMETSP1107-20130205/3977_1 /TAXON_ID=36770 /ORGANISM="Paraphysomonas vestita, Strain GFlagA" /LENGTH=483 /DNA_ID=CAMNT_0016035259 /DNA_START=285 /DNA_END=1736 /DNA_ORIENTATION=+